MTRSMVQRLAMILAALWAGMLGAIGFLAVPVLFLTLARQQAGSLAGIMFDRTANVALVLGVALLLLVRLLNRRAGIKGPNSSLLWVLAALFFLVAGHFGLQPMVVAARDGAATVLSFGMLHALSTVLYVLQLISAVALSWCLSAGEAKKA